MTSKFTNKDAYDKFHSCPGAIVGCFDCENKECSNFGYDTIAPISCPKQPKEVVDEYRLNRLREVVTGMDKVDAPVKTVRHGKHYEFLIGIGKDHTAFITMDDEAYEALIT